MSIIESTFEEIGQTPAVSISKGQTMAYNLFVDGEDEFDGDVSLLQSTDGGTTWGKVADFTGEGGGKIMPSQNTLFKFACTRFDDESDPITVSLADVNDVLHEIANNEGVSVFKITEKFFTGILKLRVFDDADKPSAAEHKGLLIYLNDGDSESPCLAVSDGEEWQLLAFVTAESED